jgi:hypothetical protein
VHNDFGPSADVFWGGAGNDHTIDQLAQTLTPLSDYVYGGTDGRDRLSVSSSRVNPSGYARLHLDEGSLACPLNDGADGFVEGRVVSVEVSPR